MLPNAKKIVFGRDLPENSKNKTVLYHRDHGKVELVLRHTSKKHDYEKQTSIMKMEGWIKRG